MKFPKVTGGAVVLIGISILVVLFLPLPILGVVLLLFGAFGRYFGLGFKARVALVVLGLLVLILTAFIVAMVLAMIGGH